MDDRNDLGRYNHSGPNHHLERIMASIFKRSKKKGSPYSIQYTDENGQRKTVKAFTDKGLSEQLAAKLESEVRMKRTGLIDASTEGMVGHSKSNIQSHT